MRTREILRGMKKDPLLCAAQHEAAHAVMRMRYGLAPTALSIDDQGGGFCEGTGEPIRAEQMVMVLLAGYAWERCAWTLGAALSLPVWPEVIAREKEQNRDGGIGDATHAASLMEEKPWIRPCESEPPHHVMEVNVSLNRRFLEAATELKAYRGVVITIGDQLRREKHLAAPEVKEIWRSFGLA